MRSAISIYDVSFSRAFGNDNAEEFKCLVMDVFEAMGHMLAVDCDVIAKTQVSSEISNPFV